MDPINEAYQEAITEAKGTPLYTIEIEDTMGNTFFVTAGAYPNKSMYYIMRLNGKGVSHDLRNIRLKKSPPSRMSSPAQLEKELKAAFSSSKIAKMVNFYPYDKFA